MPACKGIESLDELKVLNKENSIHVYQVNLAVTARGHRQRIDPEWHLIDELLLPALDVSVVPFALESVQTPRIPQHIHSVHDFATSPVYQDKRLN